MGERREQDLHGTQHRHSADGPLRSAVNARWRQIRTLADTHVAHPCVCATLRSPWAQTTHSTSSANGTRHTPRASRPTHSQVPRPTGTAATAAATWTACGPTRAVTATVATDLGLIRILVVGAAHVSWDSAHWRRTHAGKDKQHMCVCTSRLSGTQAGDMCVFSTAL